MHIQFSVGSINFSKYSIIVKYIHTDIHIMFEEGLQPLAISLGCCSWVPLRFTVGRVNETMLCSLVYTCSFSFSRLYGLRYGAAWRKAEQLHQLQWRYYTCFRLSIAHSVCMYITIRKLFDRTYILIRCSLQLTYTRGFFDKSSRSRTCLIIQCEGCIPRERLILLKGCSDESGESLCWFRLYQAEMVCFLRNAFFFAFIRISTWL